MPTLAEPRRLMRLALAAAATLAVPAAALAHHSYSMFDHAKTVTISGSVRTWEMVNPHSYLWVVSKTPEGVEQIWGLEGGGIAALSRAGVTKSAVKPGEKISVDIHPLRDGRTGGMLLKVTLADGRSISMGGMDPPRGAAGAAAAE